MVGGRTQGRPNSVEKPQTDVNCCMLASRFSFGPFVLSPENGTLLRHGLPVPVGYRGILILGALLKNAGEVVAKSALMDAAWPGTAVEDGNLSVQVASLRKLLGPSPDGTEWIATVPRVGYRFTGSVQTLDRDTNPREGSSDGGPSLAVLPFASLSDDPEQAFFAEGLTEDIITALARLRWLFVTARNSSHTYKGRAVDVKQVGRELGVRYLLEGSVRRAGGQVRVNAQLADTATGAQLWAARYDAALADFFALQDQITESVVATIEPQLYAAEHIRFRSKPPDSLDAWGFAMRAMPYVWDWGSAGDIETAEALLSRATAIDPNYPRANSLLAWMLGARAHLGLGTPTEILATALTMAQRAIKSDPDDPWGHLAAGYVHMVSRHTKLAVEELKEAVDRNPSFAHAHVFLGATYAYAGMVDDGLGEAELAIRLSPRDYSQAAALSVIGLCHLVGGGFRDAVDFERRAVQLRPHFGTAWRTLAAAAGLAGDLGIAGSALAEAKRLQPSLSIEWVEKYHAIVNENDRATYCDGLRRAGLT